MICFSVIFLQLNSYRALIGKKSGCLRSLAVYAFLHYIAQVSQKTVGLAACCNKAFLKVTETCGHVFPLILCNLGGRNLIQIVWQVFILKSLHFYCPSVKMFDKQDMPEHSVY